MNHRVALFIALMPLAAFAQDGDAERDRIRAERAAIESRFQSEQVVCRGKFAVNDCLDEARGRRREALADLRRQEITLNDAERRRRSAERLREIESRQSPEQEAAAAKRRSEALADQAQRERRAADKAGERAQRASEAAAAAPAPREAKGPITPQPTPAEARDRQAGHAEKVRAAREHKAQVLQRNAERAKPPASGLPTPP